MSEEGLSHVQRWAARQEEGARLELVCPDFPDPERGDRTRTVIRMTTCVNQVPAHELLELFSVGAQTIVLRCTDPVNNAAHVLPAARVLMTAGLDRLRIEDEAGTSALGGGGSDGAGQEGQAGPASRDSSVAGPSSGAVRSGRRRRPRTRRPIVRDVLDAAQMPIPRRQVLGLGAGPVRELPDQSQSAPRRLNAAIAALIPPSDAVVDALNESVQLAAPGCTACNVCVRACPTDALNLRTFGASAGTPDDVLPGPAGPAASSDGAGSGVTTLLQDPASCDGCGICVQMCPENVLEIRGAWDWSTVLTAARDEERKPVVSLTTAACTRCGTRFPTTAPGSLCPVCTFRRANPFASRMPPGF